MMLDKLMVLVQNSLNPEIGCHIICNRTASEIPLIQIGSQTLEL